MLILDVIIMNVEKVAERIKVQKLKQYLLCLLSGFGVDELLGYIAIV